MKSFMLDVLSPLITESDNVSTELLDIILINIVEPNKSAKKNAYHLAKELITKTHETIEQYIQQVSEWRTPTGLVGWVLLGNALQRQPYPSNHTKCVFVCATYSSSIRCW